MITRRSFCALMGAAALPADRLGVVCILDSTEKGSWNTLRAAGEAGFRQVQVSFPWDRVDAAYLSGLQKWLRFAGVRAQVLSAYVNCVDPPVVLMNTRAEDFARAIGYAGELGCNRLVAWTGSHRAGLMQPDARNFTEASQDAILRFLDPHLKRLEDARLRLALESYITLACPDAPSLRRLLDRLPSNIGAVLDPPNLTPIARFAERDQVLREMASTLRGRVEVVHLKDFRLAPDGKSYQLPGPLAGQMNYRLFAEEIRTLPETVPVFAEHIGPDKFGETRRGLLSVLK